jgi:hypothetical protein
MKTAFTILIAYLLFNSPDVSEEKWIIDQQSSLRIEGKTNVNTFNCSVKKYLHADTLTFYSSSVGEGNLSVKGAIVIDVNEFACQKKYMNGDFKKTIKARESPYLSIRLISISNFNKKAQPITGTVFICLAGVKREVEVTYTVEYEQGGNILLNGSCNILFSDFGLTPPTKFSGLVKVSQEIQVYFSLRLIKA